MGLNSDWAKEIRKIFKSNGDTAKSAAEKMGMSEQNLSKALSRGFPSGELMERIVAYEPTIDLNNVLRVANDYEDAVFEKQERYGNAQAKALDELQEKLDVLRTLMSRK